MTWYGSPSPWKISSSMRQDLLVDRLALLRRAEGEHLDLGELVHAVQPARVAAGGAGLGAEAVRQADVLERQFGLVEDLVAVHAAERDLGRGDQAQVGVRDAVDLPRLGFGSRGMKPMPSSTSTRARSGVMTGV